MADVSEHVVSEGDALGLGQVQGEGPGVGAGRRQLNQGLRVAHLTVEDRGRAVSTQVERSVKVGEVIGGITRRWF